MDSGGDVSIWSMGTFNTDNTRMLDYVCWGDPTDGGPLTRTADAINVGKWIGACAAAIPTGGSLVRLPNTMGTTAADYQTQTTPTREDCE
jgi:hypothetical protein